MRIGECETVDRHPDSDTLPAFREWAGRTALEALLSDHHLSDEELDAAVDEGVEHPHAAVCAMCRAEVEDLRRFSVPSPLRGEGQGEGRLSHKPPSKRWLLAAAAACAVLALSAMVLLLSRTRPDVAPVTASNPALVVPGPVAPVTVTPPASRVVASLADGADRIALLENGTLDGVDVLTPRDAEDARAVLAGRAIAIPTFIAAMPGAVRGGTATAHPLRAIEPFRSAVLGARPRFSWTRVRDARSYRVAVFDENYEEVARSETLDGTSWTPPNALPAGVDLSWHVVAETDAGEMSSTGADRAEAVFRVLTPAEAAEVGRGEAHYRRSHLLRGLVYSRYGLLHDARREFGLLAEQNPDSPVARALIGSVSR
jgi:hypothetical protein